MAKLSSKHRINVVLTLRQYKGLLALAMARGESVATMIREAVDVKIAEKIRAD